MGSGKRGGFELGIVFIWQIIPEHEFAQLTKESTPMNVWHDSIELVALDKKVYYKVAAVDRSNNFSAFSTMLRPG
jgi:hypothetical protein